MRKKLEEGLYNNPWEFVDDMWLIFNNAWLYNRKTSKVYKFCTKVGDKFLSLFLSICCQVFPCLCYQ